MGVGYSVSAFSRIDGNFRAIAISDQFIILPVLGIGRYAIIATVGLSSMGNEGVGVIAIARSHLN